MQCCRPFHWLVTIYNRLDHFILYIFADHIYIYIYLTLYSLDLVSLCGGAVVGANIN